MTPDPLDVVDDGGQHTLSAHQLLGALALISDLDSVIAEVLRNLHLRQRTRRTRPPHPVRSRTAMTDTTAEPGTFAPIGPEPRLRDLVRVRFVLEDHQEHPGVIIDILRRPSIPNGDRYRVRFRDGITDWYWRDELTVVPFTVQAETVRDYLTVVRTFFDHAITAARDHELLHRALGEVFDALTATANTYLGGDLDALTATAAPTD